MYVIIHKNRLIAGPMTWNRGIFTGALEKLGIVVQLPRTPYSDNLLPYEINQDTRICKGRIETPEFNDKIERTYGPIWNISSDKQLIPGQTQDNFNFTPGSLYEIGEITLSNGSLINIIEVSSEGNILKFELIDSGNPVSPQDMISHGDGFSISVREDNLEFIQKEIIGIHGIKYKEISSIKHELKEVIADNRYNKEQAGIKVTIQGVEVSADTSRDGRNIFLQKYSLMSEQEVVNWKFPETWLQITKNDLGLIIQAGASYIQSCFDWELNKINEIDACETVQELNLVNLDE